MSKILNGREVLEQLARGEAIEQFEVKWKHFTDANWCAVSEGITINRLLSDDIVFRRKPATRVINGFTVPAPLTTMNKGDEYYTASVTSDGWTGSLPIEYSADEVDALWLSRGLCFATREAAIANAKAMCGINPEE